MFKRILLPLDGSSLSEEAIPYASEMAKRFNAEVLVLQVVVPTPITSSVAAMESPTSISMMMEAAKKEDMENASGAERYLKSIGARLSTEGVKSSSQVLMGSPSPAIIQFIQENPVDLIVMTTRGRGGLKRFVLGSVTDDLVRSSTSPVMVIPPKGTKNKK